MYLYNSVLYVYFIIMKWIDRDIKNLSIQFVNSNMYYRLSKVCIIYYKYINYVILKLRNVIIIYVILKLWHEIITYSIEDVKHWK